MSETVTVLRMYGKTLTHFNVMEIGQELNYRSHLLTGLPARAWPSSIHALHRCQREISRMLIIYRHKDVWKEV